MKYIGLVGAFFEEIGLVHLWVRRGVCHNTCITRSLGVALLSTSSRFPLQTTKPVSGNKNFLISPSQPSKIEEGIEVSKLGWDDLRSRIVNCTSCTLCKSSTNIVFGVGDRKASWMLIGEAPGESEDLQGEPFVGQAGKLLDNMLQSLSLNRSKDIYITNVVKCRPPGNRNPKLSEISSCMPYLRQQINLVRPNLIIALGKVSAQTLLQSESSVMSMRGRVHIYNDNIPVIVTYHPAYLLRSLHEKSKAWMDLCLARDKFLSKNF